MTRGDDPDDRRAVSRLLTDFSGDLLLLRLLLSFLLLNSTESFFLGLVDLLSFLSGDSGPGLALLTFLPALSLLLAGDPDTFCRPLVSTATAFSAALEI